MPTRRLPVCPNLDELKVQAVELVDAIWRDDVEAVRRLVTAKAWGRSHSTGGS